MRFHQHRPICRSSPSTRRRLHEYYSIEMLETRLFFSGAPTLDWSSYLGGTLGDATNGVAVDTSGSVWLAGLTNSSDFVNGSLDSTLDGTSDGFVARISPTGSLGWCRYLGGQGDEQATAISTDTSNNAWVAGYTSSTDFAINGFDTNYNGGTFDGFVAKLNSDGTLDWCTYLGGASDDRIHAMAIDQDGNAWVVGDTQSSDWVTGGFDTSYNGGAWDAFVATFNADGNLAWSSYLGGAGLDFARGIASDSSGNALVTGNTLSSGWTNGGFDSTYNGGPRDAFVAKINSGGTLAWSTYLGGIGNDFGSAISTDPSGNAWAAGETSSSDFASGGFDISHNGGTDSFITKIGVNGALVWSSYLGGNTTDFATAISVDQVGNAWVSGSSNSPHSISGGSDLSFGGIYDAYIAKINGNGSLAWSTYLGRSSNDAGGLNRY